LNNEVMTGLKPSHRNNEKGREIRMNQRKKKLNKEA
jgi:hypothetical protein